MKQFSLDEYLKNPNQKVVTRDGRNVKIHCTNYRSNQPIIAEVEGVDYSISFYLNGRFLSFGESSNCDLFFAPEKHEGWVNLYRSASYAANAGCVFTSEKEAKESIYSPSRYITTVKIEWEE